MKTKESHMGNRKADTGMQARRPCETKEAKRENRKEVKKDGAENLERKTTSGQFSFGA